MKKLLCLTVGLFCGIPVFASDKPVKSPVSLEWPGFQAGVFDVGPAYVSGQPSADALRKLAREGLTTVVSLRTQEEMDDRQEVPFDEPALLKELKVRYVHIPIGPCTPEKVKQFAEEMVKAEGKVLLHCTVAWRATYMWMAYLVSNRKYSVDDAWKDGMKMSVTVDRSALMLGQEVNYKPVPKSEADRRAKPGTLSKPDSKVKISSPKAVYPPTSDRTAFVMWDLGGILNASQPDEARLRELASQGVTRIVNLREPREMEDLKSRGYDEEKLAKELGLEYVNVPIGAWPTFTPEALAKIAAAFEGSKGKVLYHCASANRTTLAFVPYLVRYQGMSLDEATKVGEAMRWSNTMLEDFLGVEFSYSLKAKGG